MGKNLEPQCKQCRRAGEKLLLKGERCSSVKCAMIKRNYPPGFHGQKGRKRQSGFALQLAEKQKAKKTYNLLEKQFKLTFDKAQQITGDTGKNFINLLEMRLDNVIYRMGLGSSRIQARQLVNHGHFMVNDRKVNIPSYRVKAGDTIKIKKSSLKNLFFKTLPERLKAAKPVSWLLFDPKEMVGKVLHEPGREDLQSNINVQMIIEFYSK